MAEPIATVEGITKRDPSGDLLREVRLGLVLNGGVSLAIWIGGLTEEIDCLRRSPAASSEEQARRRTSALYGRLLSILRERVVVDVCAGASAGGINGALLATAVYAEQPLPPLREVWITLGDFSKLLRSPSRREPPSLLLGDEVALRELRRTFGDILAAAGRGPEDQPIYLYLTATDFHGTSFVLTDSARRPFQETKHRYVFSFEHPSPDWAGAIEAQAIAELTDGASGGMPDVASFRLPNAADLLARAARSSSSFPVAFEAHGVPFADGTRRWMIDGGVLDNQPFNPLLNRIATIDGGDVPVRRVVGYVVPYVTEPAASGAGDIEALRSDVDRNERPTAMETVRAASSLPRDLPKLDGLSRIVREVEDGRRAQRSRDRFEAFANGPDLETAADCLFPAYRRMRFEECLETFASWLSPEFQPGAGEIGQMESIDPRDALAVPTKPAQDALLDGLMWVPDLREWVPGDPWRWGLSPSERIASAALADLRPLLRQNPTDAAIREAKGYAAVFVQAIRAMKFRVCVDYREGTGTILQRAAVAYAEQVDELGEGFSTLATLLEAIPGTPKLQRLIDEEIVRNAFSAEHYAVPPVFDFIHMSAGIRNSLGHSDMSPGSKLAGMKLGHFAGFLKRSWRANDWMWGRLDGVEYAVGVVLDVDYLDTLANCQTDVFQELANFAFPAEYLAVLSDAWMRTLNFARSRTRAIPGVDLAISYELDNLTGATPPEQFAALLWNAANQEDRDLRAGLLDCCRGALAARIQLEILAEELPEIAEAIRQDLNNGASRGSSGAEWARRPMETTDQERVSRFRSLRIGAEEAPIDEASSRMGLDVASHATAVAAAAFSGSGGGLPLAVRAPLATVRGLTLVFHAMVRLLVRTPALGIAALLVAGVALMWALLRPNALLGTVVPALAAVVIGGAAVLIAMFTSLLEVRARSVRQYVGLLAVIAMPLALLALLLSLPFGWSITIPLVDEIPLSTGDPREWLNKRVPDTAIEIAIVLVAVAALSGVAMLLLGWTARKLRIVGFWTYRWCLLLAASIVAAGVVYQRASTSEDRWQGAMIILLLFGAISLVPLVAELAAGLRWGGHHITSRESWRTGFLSQSFLELWIWLLFFLLLVPAALVGWFIGHQTSDPSRPPAEDGAIGLANADDPGLR